MPLSTCRLHLHGAKGKQRVNENVVVINVLGQQPLKCLVLFIPVPSFYLLCLVMAQGLFLKLLVVSMFKTAESKLSESINTPMCACLLSPYALCVYILILVSN